jgi:hypothetical protein
VFPVDEIPKIQNLGRKTRIQAKKVQRNLKLFTIFFSIYPVIAKVLIYKLRSILHCGKEIVLPRFLINCFLKGRKIILGVGNPRSMALFLLAEYEATGPGHNYVQGFYCPGSCLFNTHSYLVFVSLCPLFTHCHPFSFRLCSYLKSQSQETLTCFFFNKLLFGLIVVRSYDKACRFFFHGTYIFRSSTQHTATYLQDILYNSFPIYITNFLLVVFRVAGTRNVSSQFLQCGVRKNLNF